MRLFLKRLLLFLLLLTVSLPALDFLFSKWMQHSSRPSIEGWFNLMYEQIDADIVIVGSSRAKNHIDPVILDSILHTNAYNLGMSGTRIRLQTAQYDLYSSHNKKPDVIVFCIDVFSLVSIERVALREQYFPFFWDRRFRKAIFPIIHFTASERFIPFYRYYPGELGGMLKRYPESRKGFYAFDEQWDSPEVNSVPFEKEEPLQALFEQFVENAVEDGVKMVFVLPPLYYEKARRVRALDEMLEYYTEFGKKNQIPLFNYYFSDISKDSTNFMDPNHLNRKGAEAFSETLARDLLEWENNVSPDSTRND